MGFLRRGAGVIPCYLYVGVLASIGSGSGARVGADISAGMQSGVEVAGILKRLEAWAAHSPERSQFLVLVVCLGLGVLVLLFIGALAWFALESGDVSDLTE
jgi:hypothetical protein